MGAIDERWGWGRARGWVAQRNEADAMPAAVATLLLQLRVPVTVSCVRERVVAHSDFPRLQAVIDSLAQWGVGARAVSAQPEHLEELQGPVLAHLERGGVPRLVVLTGASGDEVSYIDPESGPRRVPRAAFAELWTGVLLLPDPRPGAGEPDYAAKRRGERLAELRRPLLFGASGLAVLALAVAALMPGGLAASAAVLALLKAAGAAACALLVWLATAPQASLAARLCPSGERLDCGAVLDSPAARIAGWIPVADVGLLYFAGGLVALGLAAAAGRAEVGRALLAALNLLALPYAVFSIVYQAHVVRRWCGLCLIVQALLCLEPLVLWWGARGASALLAPALSRSGALLAIAAYALPALAWAWVRPLCAAGAGAAALRRELERLRTHPALLRDALERQPPSASEPPHGVVLGPESAPLRLTLISNPSCPPCAQIHAELESLVERCAGQLRCSVQLAGTGSGASAQIGRRVAELAQGAGQAHAAEALAAWFADPRQPVQGWLARFPAPPDVDPEQVTQVLEAQREWLARTPHAGTPTLFLNGRPVPSEYGLRALVQYARAQARQSGAAQQRDAA